jgi:mannose-6-phosphate isomerase-like protein (cupin superfamily)
MVDEDEEEDEKEENSHPLLASLCRPAFSWIMQRFEIAQLDAIDPVRCPCGFARRAFAHPGNTTATVHVVDIQADSATHYHKTMTEIYVVLEGEGVIELDGESFPLKPMTTVMIKPGCRHRAVGQVRLLNIPIPAFDEKDEWFD